MKHQYGPIKIEEGRMREKKRDRGTKYRGEYVYEMWGGRLDKKENSYEGG